MTSTIWTNPTRGPKVCFVADRYPPDEGLVADVAHRLIANLHDAGYDMHVFVRTSTPPSNSAADLESQPPYIRRVPSDCARLQTAIDFWHRRIGFDLFHGFSIPAAFACLQIANRYRRPVIANIGNPIQQSYLDRQAHTVLRHSSWIVAGSSASLARAHRVADVASRSSIIATWPDDGDSVPWSIESAQRGTIGTLEKLSSDVGSTFSMAYRLLKNRLDCQLLGHRDYDIATSQGHDSRASKERLLTAVDSQDCASPTEEVSNAQRSSFLEMHVFVAATEEPDLPDDLLRAAARGVPIVATAVDGVKDFFTDGLNSLLVAPWDYGALARVVETVMRDDILAQRISEEASKLAKTMNVEAEQTSYRKTYARLLDCNY